jgi:proline dehydrogenase
MINVNSQQLTEGKISNYWNRLKEECRSIFEMKNAKSKIKGVKNIDGNGKSYYRWHPSRSA